MPEQKKFDPFKPQQPVIPGVAREVEALPEVSPEPAILPRQEPPIVPQLVWVAIAALVALIVAATLFYSNRDTSAKEATPAPTVETHSAAIPDSPERTESWPMAPGPVATGQEMASTWSAERFVFRNASDETEPAIVVRLPRGQYWGFSLREPFGNCELEYISDLKKLRTDYHFTADHPMVGDPCNHTVYDLLRYGSGPSNDGLVRGEIVQGPGIRPPIAIEIRTEGGKVLAVREE